MSYRSAIASMSLGRAQFHKLPNKLDQAKRFGLKGIELFFEDLEQVAKELEGGATPSNLLQAARTVRALCDDRGIQVLGLQPFMHYEGLRDREEHARRIEEMKLWIKLAHILGTDLIQIPSTFLSEEHYTGDLNTIVSDLREVADLGMQEEPVMRFAYEALAWGTYISTWEQSYEVVCGVNRSNFGLILDTYNIAARIYADPESPTGKVPNAEAAVKASIERLKSTVDVNKIFFVQLVDGQRLSSPLVPGHPLYNASQPARMAWSRNCRLFYGEQALGAYLPITDIARTILKDIGWSGWVSAELFNSFMSNEDPGVSEQLARRAAMGWKKLCADLDLRTV